MGTTIINGRYEIVGELGRGGMGVVYRARQKSLNREVAVKMLSHELAGDGAFRQRFQQEAVAIARLHHDNIVTVHDIEEDNGTFYIIMTYVEGVSLQKIMDEKGKLELRWTLLLLAQVARALDYACGKGVVHRDVKPDNIMVVDNRKAMVMDFGIAHVADSDIQTQTGLTIGTPKFMSPEQARGTEVDHRSDIYSLGIVLYVAVTGVAPFEADNPFALAVKHIQEAPPPPREKAQDLPQEVEDVILKAISKKPEDRFQSGEEFAQALEGTLAPEAGRLDTPSPGFLNTPVESFLNTPVESFLDASLDSVLDDPDAMALDAPGQSVLDSLGESAADVTPGESILGPSGESILGPSDETVLDWMGDMLGETAPSTPPPKPNASPTPAAPAPPRKRPLALFLAAAALGVVALATWGLTSGDEGPAGGAGSASNMTPASPSKPTPPPSPTSTPKPTPTPMAFQSVSSGIQKLGKGAYELDTAGKFRDMIDSFVVNFQKAVDQSSGQSLSDSQENDLANQLIEAFTRAKEANLAEYPLTAGTYQKKVQDLVTDTTRASYWNALHVFDRVGSLRPDLRDVTTLLRGKVATQGSN